jgi:hypothetical protein
MLKIFKQLIYILFVAELLHSCIINGANYAEQNANENMGYSIPISWFQELKGDFSFAEEWDYTDGIELNEYQQIICWNCPPRAEKMLDKRRKIISDSMDIFYQLIDSTRHFQSLKSRSTIVNLSGNTSISVKKYGDFTIEGFTKNEDSIHCSLFFRMKNDFINSWVYIKNNNETKILKLKEGKFFVDKSAFDKGILKANFSFIYQSENTFKPLYWSGKFYAKISGI